MWCMLQEYADAGCHKPTRGQQKRKNRDEADTVSESDGEGDKKRAMPSAKRSVIHALASAHLSSGGAK